MLRRIHPTMDSIENWTRAPPSHNVVTLSREDFERLVNSAHRAHLCSLARNISVSKGNLSLQDDDEQPQDLSISRTQSQPEICLALKSPDTGRTLSRMEQKQIQWERERAELQAMQNWGPPSMVGTPYKGRRLQPVASISPQVAPSGISQPRVTNILNLENANHVQFTDIRGQGGAPPTSGRYSIADEAKKRLGSLGSDIADPEILRLEKAQKAAEYRRAIEQQVEEKRKRKQEEEIRSKLEEEMAERKLNEERERLRKQYEEEQKKIRTKEEAEERTRQILLEKFKEAEAAAEEARKTRLRRNTTMAAPQDEFIAASVQNILKFPPPPRVQRTQSRLSSSPPLPAPRRTNSGFLATSSNLPSAQGAVRPLPQALALTANPSSPQQQLQAINQSPTRVQHTPTLPFPTASPQMQTIYPTAFKDHAEILSNVMLQQQVPMIQKCQAYLESTPAYSEDRVLTPTMFRLRRRSQSLKSLRNSAVQTDWSMSRNISPPSSTPSSPVDGRVLRRRKPVSTGALDREKSKRPPWNANVSSHAYVKNTDRDPNMHTRKKLQELRKQHWEREINQQSTWQQNTRRRIVANGREGDRAPKSPARHGSRTSLRSKPAQRSTRQADTSDTDFSIANNDTGSDYPEHNECGTDRAMAKGLRDDGVDSSEVSATASAGLLSERRSAENLQAESSAPAPAPRKTWKSQSMYIPQARAESPPVPALLNRMRLQSSEELNASRGSSHGSNLEESVDNLQASLSRSKGNISLSSVRKSPGLPTAAVEKDADRQSGVNDQKKILSQLSALRQTLLMKRQELEISISTPRMSRKAKT